MAPATTTEPARRRLLLFIILRFVSASELVVPMHGQPDALGFISIDCGIADGTSYPDDSTRGLRYVSDAGFVDAGSGANADIGPPYNDRDLALRYLNVRYFPTTDAGARSCDTLRGLSPGARYIVRESFYYGNYDSLNTLPTFNIYLGVNRWATVNFTTADDIVILEATVVSRADFLEVCLVDIRQGTPFISGLDLRLLRAGMYPEATVNQSLFLLNPRRPAAKFAMNRYHCWRLASYYRVFR